jgi:hypothetical protein
MVDNYSNSVDIYKRLSGASSRYLYTDVEYLGYVPRDDHLRLSVQKQVPVTIGYPGSQASYCFAALADNMENIYRAQPTRRSFSLFWRNLLVNRLKKTARDETTTQTPSGARIPKLVITKLQQNMVQLVKSRTLSTGSMKSLLTSLIVQVDRYYPEIRISDLQRNENPKNTVDQKNVELTN